MSRKIRFTGFLGLAVVVTVMVGIAPAEAQSDEQLVFNALAQSAGTGVTGQTPVTITITRFNTPDERDALEEVFLDKGMQALADELRSATEVGFIRAPSISGTGWRLRYAMMYQGPDNKRILRIATDRPVSFVEAMQNSSNWTWDYNVSLIELVVDDDGNGEGVLFTGVEFGYDQANDSLSIKSLSTQPVRLVNVRKR